MLVIRLVLSLAFVAVLLFVALRVAKNRAGASGAGVMEVVARQPLTRGSSMAVVRVGDRLFVVGASETQVTLIAETDEESLALPVPVPGAVPARPVSAPTVLSGSVFDPAGWRALVGALREKTIRR